MSYEYYNKHANDFYQGTINADMSEMTNKFLAYLKPGAHILDAGCGVGRDTQTFLKAGFKVTAFDASEEMVRISSEFTGHKTMLLKFEDCGFVNEFDAIWASASLLHVKKEDMPNVFRKLHRALTVNGILFVSFKSRDEDFSKDERNFSCYTKESLRSFIESTNLFAIAELWSSLDVREGRENECWTNSILIKNDVSW